MHLHVVFDYTASILAVSGGWMHGPGVREGMSEECLC